MPLVTYLKQGASKAAGWHRNEERLARGLDPVTNLAAQLESWERQLAVVEILLLGGGTPYANFKELAHGWGRKKGFHTTLIHGVCERRGEIIRKRKSEIGMPVSPPPKSKLPKANTTSAEATHDVNQTTQPSTSAVNENASAISTGTGTGTGEPLHDNAQQQPTAGTSSHINPQQQQPTTGASSNINPQQQAPQTSNTNPQRQGNTNDSHINDQEQQDHNSQSHSHAHAHNTAKQNNENSNTLQEPNKQNATESQNSMSYSNDAKEAISSNEQEDHDLPDDYDPDAPQII
jgi:hypothetical protein